MPYPTYSIVIPAYNEAARIGNALQSVVACVRKRGWRAEIVVVDDGSRDQTAEIVRAFAKDHPEFLKAFAAVIAKEQNSFVGDKTVWGPDSENAKLLAGLLGGTPADQASALKNLNLLPLKTQASDAWLGGGENSGLAKILKDTAVFLKDQKKISDVLPSYAAFVTPDVVIAVDKGAGS